jgi:hypothetical protein
MKKNYKISTTDLKKGCTGLLFFLMISVFGFSQNVGISPDGSVPANTSAGLDVYFTTQGLLIPRIALINTSNYSPLASHVAGMIVYNTATTADVTPGFYFNDGTKWVAAYPKASSAGDMQYWNGTAWVNISVGQPGQMLHINGSGVPTWAP